MRQSAYLSEWLKYHLEIQIRGPKAACSVPLRAGCLGRHSLAWPVRGLRLSRRLRRRRRRRLFSGRQRLRCGKPHRWLNRLLGRLRGRLLGWLQSGIQSGWSGRRLGHQQLYPDYHEADHLIDQAPPEYPLQMPYAISAIAATKKSVCFFICFS